MEETSHFFLLCQPSPSRPVQDACKPTGHQDHESGTLGILRRKTPGWAWSSLLLWNREHGDRAALSHKLAGQTQEQVRQQKDNPLHLWLIDPLRESWLGGKMTLVHRVLTCLHCCVGWGGHCPLRVSWGSHKAIPGPAETLGSNRTALKTSFIHSFIETYYVPARQCVRE